MKNFKELMELANKGDAFAQYYIAEHHMGNPKTEAEAAKWLDLAVEKLETMAREGNADAMYLLGEFYGREDLSSMDQQESERWYLMAANTYRAAAETGDSEAQFRLGLCYANGHGVTKSEEEAFGLYKLAAESGHHKAQFSLGSCYMHGEGIEADAEEGIRWYKLAADQGDAIAHTALGRYFQSVADYEKALTHFLIAAEDGYSIAQIRLGDCYYDGIGTAQDREEAMKWYRLAEENGRRSPRLD